MWRSTISEGLSQGEGLGLPVRGGKLLKSIAAQGISPAGLEDFKRQWSEGRVFWWTELFSKEFTSFLDGGIQSGPIY